MAAVKLYIQTLAVITLCLLILSCSDACNVGLGNLGFGNVGVGNMGLFNRGVFNGGFSNTGALNRASAMTIGVGNVGTMRRIGVANIIGVPRGRRSIWQNNNES
ncbi:unnamed protein product [Orchesella dallaii]|uniref:Uncharacterized protein n=1 Tax=Orchesella dallaii TaxID=48710 RepID=A0ABP1R2G0_9HEXA